MDQMLFVCTGNYYRSRFAEGLFNYLCQSQDIPWRAFSRGLAIHLADGDLAYQTAQALTKRGIPLDLTGPTRVSLTRPDLERATRIIALDRVEHYDYMAEQFPDWADRIEYWNAQDLQWEGIASCLEKIDRGVHRLVSQLKSNGHT